MSETQENTQKEMTAAQAAKLVKRPEVILNKETKKPVLDADGKVKTKLVAVSADEVLAFKDYGDYVVVVTKDGQKFSSAEDQG